MKKLYITLFLSIFLLFACATINSLHQGSGSTFTVIDRTYDEIWKSCVKVVTISLTIVESNKYNGVIKAEKRAGLATSGEVVGIFITTITE